MTDAEHIGGVRLHAIEVRSMARKQSVDSDKIRRRGRFVEAQRLWDASQKSMALADSLARVVALADAAPELLAIVQEMYDYGQPTEHYRDNARGKAAWERAEQVLERFRDEAWLLADYDSESREVDDE